ncbi:polysaccharide deacetylase family protein [Specibacter cremeus]|uniref:polysaccharide deacetylase family protein n=1 Tax=Specibacter cremeus TaxID=1629051 RepID=UPI000F774E0E|nr:polysaccharide deacetylase family protein [Specibacter cremeus]
MPRHLHATRGSRRLPALLAAGLVLVLIVVAGVWIFGRSGTTAGPATAASSPSAGAGSRTATPTPSPSATATPGATRVPASSLDGLVPDFKLPPIENGLAPVLTKIPTEQKVVFLTIDDGAVKRSSDVALLAKYGYRASLFLANAFIAPDPAFFKQYTAGGSLVEDHSMTHNLGFINLGYEAQKAEICQMADFEEKEYGRRPVFFRPPGGPYTESVQRAVAACGLKAIIDWEAKANAGGMQYQVGDKLRPGEIVLMHFRPEFAQDLGAFAAAQKAAGLKVVLLEDYLGVK